MQPKPILSTLTKKEKHIQCHEIHGQFHEIRVRGEKPRAGRTGSRASQWPLGQSSYAVSLGHFSYCDLTPATLSHGNPSVLNSDSWGRKSNSLSLGQISVPGLSVLARDMVLRIWCPCLYMRVRCRERKTDVNELEIHRDCTSKGK